MLTKSIARIITLVMLLSLSFTTVTKAITIDSLQSKAPIERVSNRSTELLNRLNEIKNIDKSTLTRSEKKELRVELRSIKKEMQKSSNGVYLSVGAIIIIILLLIILL